MLNKYFHSELQVVHMQVNPTSDVNITCMIKCILPPPASGFANAQILRWECRLSFTPGGAKSNISDFRGMMYRDGVLCTPTTWGVCGHTLLSPPRKFLNFRLSETTSGASSCHLQMDHIICADTLPVEGNTKHMIKS